MTEILIFISSNFAFEIYSKHGNIRVRVKEKTITKGDLHTAQWKIRCTSWHFFLRKKCSHNAHCQFSGFWFIPFPVIFLVKRLNCILTCDVFREIATFTSRISSFNNFFSNTMNLLATLLVFYDFKPSFLLEVKGHSITTWTR